HAPLAVAVHEDHAIAGRLRDAARHAAVLEGLLEDDRPPPRAVHVSELGANGGGHPDEIALTGWNSTTSENLSSQIVARHLRVAGEAAGSEDHAFACVHCDGLAFRLGFDADDLALTVDHETLDAVLQQDGDLALVDHGPQLLDKRCTGPQTIYFGGF